MISLELCAPMQTSIIKKFSPKPVILISTAKIKEETDSMAYGHFA